MPRWILCVLLTVALLAEVASPARACMWDRDTISHEKQFKSKYLDSVGDNPSRGLPMDGVASIVRQLAGGGGVFLLLSGLTVGLVRGVARQRGQSSRNPFSDGPS
ncbi:MAG: hypothetical protein ACRCZF_16115 [Gemmataceae bacterium]